MLRSFRFCILLFSCLCFLKSNGQCDTQFLRYHNAGIQDIHMIDTSRIVAVGEGAIITSMDGGVNWKRNDAIYNNNLVWFGNLSFPSSRVGYASTTSASMLKTEDGGNTWFSLVTPVSGVVRFKNELTGYVLGGGDVYGTTNGGITWNLLLQSGGSLRDLAILPNGTIYVVGWNNVLLKSTNGGINWGGFNINAVPGNTIMSAIKFFNDQVGYITSEDAQVLKTVNGGTTWTLVHGPSTTYYVRDFVMLDANTVIAVGGSLSDQPYVIRTTDGGINWTEYTSTTTLGRFNYYCIATDPQRTKLIMGGAHEGISSNNNKGGRRIVTSYDNGVTWLDRGSAHHYTYTSVQMFNDSTGYLTGETGSFLETTDRGETWRKICQVQNTTFYAMQFLDRQNGYILSDSIYKTTNAGRSWQNCGRPSTQPNYYTQWLYFKDVDNGYVSDGYYLYKTTNGGQNWATVNPLPSIANKHSIYFKGDKGFIVGPTAIRFQTTNGGVSWSPMTLQTNQSLSCVHFYNDSIGFVGSFGNRVYRTSNGGLTWDSLTVDVPNGLFTRFFHFVSDSVGYMEADNYNVGYLLKTTNKGWSWRILAISSTLVAASGSSTPIFVGRGGNIGKLAKLAAPPISNAISGLDSVCLNSRQIYYAEPIPGINYTWSLSGGGTSGVNNNVDTIRWTTAGTFNLILRTNNLCGASPPRILPVTVVNFTASVTQLNDSTLQSSPGISYQWYRGNNIIAGATNQIYQTNIPASYKVFVTNSIGCQAMSPLFPLIITATNDPRLAAETKLFPSPVDRIAFLRMENNSRGKVEIKVINVMGQVLHRQSMEKVSTILDGTLNMEAFSAGVYFVEISFKGKRTVLKVVKK